MTFNEAGSGPKERFNRRRILQSGAIAVGGLTLGIGPAAATDAPQTFTRDFAGESRDIPCRDEKATLTQGVQHVKIHTSIDEDGGIHFNATLRFDPLVVAVGEKSEIEWSGQGMKSFSETLRGPFPQTFTRIDNTTLTAAGATENIRLHGELHFTVNANGEVTAVRDEITVECFG